MGANPGSAALNTVCRLATYPSVAVSGVLLVACEDVLLLLLCLLWIRTVASRPCVFSRLTLVACSQRVLP